MYRKCPLDMSGLQYHHGDDNVIFIWGMILVNNEDIYFTLSENLVYSIYLKFGKVWTGLKILV